MTARRTSALLVLASLVLTGCTDDSDPGDPPQDGFTGPGTSLAVGEAASVPVADFDEVEPAQDGSLELAVTSIDPGDPAALEKVGMEGTPYFVHVEATSAGGDVYGFFPDQVFTAFVGDEMAQGLANPLSIDPSCVRTTFDQGAAVGETLDTCLTFVVPSGSGPLDRVVYDDDADYQVAEGTELTWQ